LEEYESLIEQLRGNKNDVVTVEEQDKLEEAMQSLEENIDDFNFDNTRQFRQNPYDEDDEEIDYDMGDEIDYDMD
jgi:hypothetical protein